MFVITHAAPLDRTLTCTLSCAHGQLLLQTPKLIISVQTTRLLRLKGSYQAEGEQPRRREPVRHEDEAQSADGDGGPEDAVQTASSLVAHQQRRGDGVGVDKAGVGALPGEQPQQISPTPSLSEARPGFQKPHQDPVSEEDDDSTQSMDNQEGQSLTLQISRAAAGQHATWRGRDTEQAGRLGRQAAAAVRYREWRAERSSWGARRADPDPS